MTRWLATPRLTTLCYIYNARHYKATLLSVHPVAERKVHMTLRGNGGAFDRTYRHLQEAHFEVVNEEAGHQVVI